MTVSENSVRSRLPTVPSHNDKGRRTLRISIEFMPRFLSARKGTGHIVHRDHTWSTCRMAYVVNSLTYPVATLRPLLHNRANRERQPI